MAFVSYDTKKTHLGTHQIMPANNNIQTAYWDGDHAHRTSQVAATGTVTQCSGLVSITAGSAAAITLTTPVAGRATGGALGGDDGKELVIISETAFAHTVTAPGGFNGGATPHIATFGAAKANNLVLVARNGSWWVKSSVGVTLS